MGTEIQLLIIEEDEGRIDQIQRTLTEEIYKIEISVTWEDALQKISSSDFDLIMCSNRIANREVTWFLDELVQTYPNKLNLPFIICRTTENIRNEVERVFLGRRFQWIDKESADYVYELEWLIMGFSPRIFNSYRRRLDESINGFKDARALIDLKTREIERIQKKLKVINENSGEIQKIKKEYMRRKDIIETLILMVSAFTMATGFIFSAMIIFFKGSIETVCIPVLPILVLFGFCLLFWGYLPYLLFKKSAKKIAKEKTDEIIDEWRAKNQRKKILVVDDDEDNINLLNYLLGQEGYEVHSAKNGAEAIRKAIDTFFQVIVLDLRMPGMDGIQVLEKLKAESPQSQVLILTAYGSDESIKKACAANVIDFIEKPVDNILLLHKIDKAFEYADALLQKEKQGEKT
ncbi:MAG: hypothetical protein QG657_5804 [Acidobacteriota bacterium]|nr:hypothetical protein [Acidobacteriota bacterium]